MMIRVDTPEDLHEVVAQLETFVEQGHRLILLFGELGSGKTTLVKAYCQQAGVEEPVNSPTFSIVHEYHSTRKGNITHMDLYRLDKTQDLEQIGLSEYLDSGNLCFIEWPEVANDYFTMPHLRVDIEVVSNKIRNFRITAYDSVDA